MKEFKPTAEQTAILEHEESCVITACPGSGKTAVIAAKIRQTLLSTLKYRGVIAISYTRKASAELRRRCTFDGIDAHGSFFGTIDSFSISEIVRPFLPHFSSNAPKKLEVVKRNSLEGYTLEIFERLQSAEIDNVIEIAVQLFQQGTLVLESVPTVALAIIRKSKACQRYLASKYTHLFIDEYQDAGYLQHQLFLSLHALGITATAVGDLRQSIYAYDGRDPKFLADLSKDKKFKHFELTQNHRSHNSIINYSNRLRDQDAELLPIDKLTIYRKTVSGGPKDIAFWIDEKLASMMKHFNVEHRNGIAILVRSNASAERISTHLKSPHKIFRDAALENSPTKFGKLFAALLKMRFDKGSTVQSLWEELEFDGPRLEKQRLRRALDMCKRGPYEDLDANIIKTVEILSGGSLDEEDIELLESTIADPVEVAALTPAADDQIQVMTLHKSKGLEFDVVLHLDLYDWIIPKRQVVDGASEPVFDNYDQCLNLHYVGVTRAKKGCILLGSTERINAKGRQVRAAPSQFLSLPNFDSLYKTLGSS